jgi:hypothetical protein
MQSGSWGHDRQFVALPASFGFLARRKNFLEPVEVMWDGRWGGLSADLKGCVHSIHMRKSISWQDFVRSEGAVVDSLRQFPLFSSS